MLRLINRSAVLRRACASTMLAGGLFAASTATAQIVPTGAAPATGGVSVGAATALPSGGLGLTVTQTGTRDVINWSTFNVGALDRVTFDQSSASAAVLNRVTGGTASTIAGQIGANGSVYLVNPNGIAITASGAVQTGGGFVASTLDMADGDFLAGTDRFTGPSAAAAVGNAGQITGNGFVALLGGTVSHSGTITVATGRVALGAGAAITLDVNGSNFLSVLAPTSAVAADGAGLIDVAGSIVAQQGTERRSAIVIGTGEVASALRNAINLTGTLSADNATGGGGGIVLTAGSRGAIAVSGSVTSRGTAFGGSISVSGDRVDVNDARFDTTATATGGLGGTVTVDGSAITANASLGSAFGASGNVSLAATVSGSGDGAVRVGGPLVSSGTGALTLRARTDIALAGVTAPSLSLLILAGGSNPYIGTVGSSGAIDVGDFTMNFGTWQQVGAVPAFRAGSFRLNLDGARFLRATGGSGTTADPYVIADVYGLQGIASSDTLNAAFRLGQNIDATGTAAWTSNAGFVPIGTTGVGLGTAAVVWNGTAFVSGGSTGFTGTLDGAGFTIQNLAIARSSASNVGLFGVTSGTATVRNIGLTNAAITGSSNTGALIGLAGKAVVANAYSTGRVTGAGGTGGLVGSFQTGSTANAYSSATVIGVNNVGGLIGGNTAAVSNSYATGNVTGSGSIVGGLFGVHSFAGLVSDLYATGNVAGGSVTGGLIGFMGAGTLTRGTASGTVNGTSSVGGLIGTLVGGSQVLNSSAGGRVIAGGGGGMVGGLIGSMGEGAGVSGSSATGNVSSGGGINVGGLIGRMYRAETGAATSITNSSATGTASGGSAVGGLVGGIQVSGGGAATITGSSARGAVSATATLIGGLVGQAQASGTATGTAISIASSYATGAVSTTSVSLTSYVGGLVGYANKGGADINTRITISNAYATGNVSSVGGMVGGLVGAMSNAGTTLDTVYATGTVNGSSTIGGLVGFANTNIVITNAYATGRVSSTGIRAGGLVGLLTNSIIANAYATGAASTTSVAGLAYVGGLVGQATGANSRISNAYATGAASAPNRSVGGLVGAADTAGNTISDVYATGSVRGGTIVGGLIGSLDSATVSRGYASGAVTATTAGGLAGGLIGQMFAGAISDAHFDSHSTGMLTGVGQGDAAPIIERIGEVTSDPMRAADGNYAYSAGAYTFLANASGLGTANVGGFVFLPGGLRPFLAFEVPVAGNPLVTTVGGAQTILNAHQLQLINYNAATLSGSYLMAGNIDLAETGRVVAGTPASYSGMWAGTGFVSLGTNGAGLSWDGTTYRSIGTITSGIYGFSGTLDGTTGVAGGRFALSNLFVDRANTGNTGLFGTVSGTVRNLVLGGSVRGGNATGGLAGMLIGGPTTSTTGASPVVSNVTSNVAVTGLQVVGGLIGSATQRSSVSGTANGTVNGTNTVGGLIGSANRSLVNGSANGAVTGQGYIGGLIGQQFGGTTTGFATGAVSGTIAVGGLIGVLDGTAADRGIANATQGAQGSITGPSTADRNFGRITANGTGRTINPN